MLIQLKTDDHGRGGNKQPLFQFLSNFETICIFITLWIYCFFVKSVVVQSLTDKVFSIVFLFLLCFDAVEAFYDNNIHQNFHIMNILIPNIIMHWHLNLLYIFKCECSTDLYAIWWHWLNCFNIHIPIHLSVC